MLQDSQGQCQRHSIDQASNADHFAEATVGKDSQMQGSVINSRDNLQVVVSQQLSLVH